MYNKNPKSTFLDQHWVNCKSVNSFLSNECCCNIFKNHLSAHKYKKFYRVFFSNLFFLSIGLKCGYLIDKISVDQNIIFNIISDLIQSKLIGEYLKVTIVNGDILIINVEKFLIYLKKKQVFIDTSSYLTNPVPLPNEHPEVVKIKETLQDIFDKFLCESKELKRRPQEVTEPVTVNISGLCVPTVVGLLLNFPIIYWYEGDYNLTSVKLSVYKVMVESKFALESTAKNKIQPIYKPFELYSFSSPLIFQHDRIVRNFLEELKINITYSGKEELSIKLIQTVQNDMNIVL